MNTQKQGNGINRCRLQVRAEERTTAQLAGIGAWRTAHVNIAPSSFVPPSLFLRCMIPLEYLLLLHPKDAVNYLTWCTCTVFRSSASIIQSSRKYIVITILVSELFNLLPPRPTTIHWTIPYAVPPRRWRAARSWRERCASCSRSANCCMSGQCNVNGVRSVVARQVLRVATSTFLSSIYISMKQLSSAGNVFSAYTPSNCTEAQQHRPSLIYSPGKVAKHESSHLVSSHLFVTVREKYVILFTKKYGFVRHKIS